MQSVGLRYALLPVLEGREWRSEKPGRDQSKIRFFNTNPVMSGFVIGVLARLLDQNRGEPDPLLAERMQERLASLLGGIGDYILLSGFLPALTLGSVVLSLTHGLAGVVVCIVCYNAVVLYLRWTGVSRGAALGTRIAVAIGHVSWGRIHQGLRGTGAFLCGAALVLMMLRPGSTGVEGSVLGAGTAGAGAGVLLTLRFERARLLVGCATAVVVLLEGLVRG